MKSYTIRLYRIHDYDLLSLMLLHNFDVRKAMYISLKNFCAGHNTVFETPPEQYPLPPKMCSEVRIYIRIDLDEDPEIIDLLSKVREGSRNAFIKGLLRLYLCNPAPNEFMETESDADDMVKMLNRTFRDGRRTIHFENMMLSKAYRKSILQQIERNASEENRDRKRKQRPRKQNPEFVLYPTKKSSTLELSSISAEGLTTTEGNTSTLLSDKNIQLDPTYQDVQSDSSEEDFLSAFVGMTRKDD